MAKVSQLRVTWQAVACALLLALSVPALSKADDTVQFDIASQPLSTALKSFAEQAKMQILYRQDVVEGAMANAVVGSYDKRNALQQLIRGTGLEIVFSADNAATIRTKTDVSANAQGTAGSQPRGLQIAQNEQNAQSKDSAQSAQSTESTKSDSPSSEGESGKLEEVVVTAQKRGAQRLLDVPIPVTAISADSLTDSGQLRIRDYFSSVPGLTLTPGG